MRVSTSYCKIIVSITSGDYVAVLFAALYRVKGYQYLKWTDNVTRLW